jgi:hypothetical protein
VIAAMMRRGSELQQQAVAASIQTNLVAAVADMRTRWLPPRPNSPPRTTAESAGADRFKSRPRPRTDASKSAPADAPAEVQPLRTTGPGSWYQVPNWVVWQPSVVTSPGWAPYCHGEDGCGPITAGTGRRVTAGAGRRPLRALVHLSRADGAGRRARVGAELGSAVLRQLCGLGGASAGMRLDGGVGLTWYGAE